MSRRRTTVAVVTLALALTSSGCRQSGPEETPPTSVGSSEATSGKFGTLEQVCGPGDAKGATAPGVTDDQIQVGTMTDFGFSKKREFIDAALVFTSWCNDAGGINGREVVSETRDAKLFEYRQRVLEACKEDFMLVGGSGAFDNTGTRDRVKCLLPEFPAQVVSYENFNSALQVPAMGENRTIGPYEGYYRWLTQEAHPGSGDALGLVTGDNGVTRIIAQRATEVVESFGSKVVYSDVFPPSGVSDWSPYAQALKSAGVKGVIWVGDLSNLGKLQQSMTDIGYVPDWIDANSNAYDQAFIKLAASTLDDQTVYAPLEFFPLELAEDNEPTREFLDLYEKYAPDAPITGPAVQAFSAWLLWAKAASECGDDLTRTCVFEKGTEITEWNGGGLTAPTNPGEGATHDTVCFYPVRATPEGWVSADFAANEGAFRCERHGYKLALKYPDALTLESVGVSIDDLK